MLVSSLASCGLLWAAYRNRLETFPTRHPKSPEAGVLFVRLFFHRVYPSLHTADCPRPVKFYSPSRENFCPQQKAPPEYIGKIASRGDTHV